MDLKKLNIKDSIYEIAAYQPGESSKDALKLSANENPLGCSEQVKLAFNKSRELNRYPDGNATALKAKIIEHLAQFKSENIVCGAGSDEIIGLLISAFTKEGDEIITTEHGFLMYGIYAKSFGVAEVKAAETNLTADINNILAKVTSKTRIVFIANPNNPTGTYISKAELETLRHKLPEDILLVIDGAYAEYIAEATDYESGINLALKYQNVIATRTFSKIYGLAALRIGYGVMAKELADIINRIRGPFNLNQIAQEMAIIALADQEFVQKSIEHNKKQLKFLKQELSKLKLIIHDSVANFLLFDFTSEEQVDKLVAYLQQENIFVRKVKAYNLPTKIRVTIGTEAENKLFLQKLTNFLTEHD